MRTFKDYNKHLHEIKKKAIPASKFFGNESKLVRELNKDGWEVVEALQGGSDVVLTIANDQHQEARTFEQENFEKALKVAVANVKENPAGSFIKRIQQRNKDKNAAREIEIRKQLGTLR